MMMMEMKTASRDASGLRHAVAFVLIFPYRAVVTFTSVRPQIRIKLKTCFA